MKNARKYVLVDPTEYEKMQNKQCGVSQTTTMQPMSERRLMSLDGEIMEILNSDKSDDIKAKLYGSALKNFKDLSRKYSPAATTDSFPAPTLGSITKEQEDDILDSISPQLKHKAKRLLNALKNNSDVSLNAQGQLIYKQTLIPNSNVLDLLTHILKTKAVSNPPPGWIEFVSALSGANLLKEHVPNYRAWKVINETVSAVSESELDQAPADYNSPQIFKTPVTQNIKTPKSVSRKRKRKKKSSPRIHLKNWTEYESN